MRLVRKFPRVRFASPCATAFSSLGTKSLGLLSCGKNTNPVASSPGCEQTDTPIQIVSKPQLKHKYYSTSLHVPSTPRPSTPCRKVRNMSLRGRISITSFPVCILLCFQRIYLPRPPFDHRGLKRCHCHKMWSMVIAPANKTSIWGEGKLLHRGISCFYYGYTISQTFSLGLFRGDTLCLMQL